MMQNMKNSIGNVVALYYFSSFNMSLFHFEIFDRLVRPGIFWSVDSVLQYRSILGFCFGYRVN